MFGLIINIRTFHPAPPLPDTLNINIDTETKQLNKQDSQNRPCDVTMDYSNRKSEKGVKWGVEAEAKQCSNYSKHYLELRLRFSNGFSITVNVKQRGNCVMREFRKRKSFRIWVKIIKSFFLEVNCGLAWKRIMCTPVCGIWIVLKFYKGKTAARFCDWECKKGGNRVV